MVVGNSVLSVYSQPSRCVQNFEEPKLELLRHIMHGAHEWYQSMDMTEPSSINHLPILYRPTWLVKRVGLNACNVLMQRYYVHHYSRPKGSREAIKYTMINTQRPYFSKHIDKAGNHTNQHGMCTISSMCISELIKSCHQVIREQPVKIG